MTPLAAALIAFGIFALVVILAALIWWDVRHPMTEQEREQLHDELTLW